MSDAQDVITCAIERSPWLSPRHIAEVVENDLVNANLLPDTDEADPANEMMIRDLSIKDGVANLTMTSGGPESEAVLLAMADAMGSMLDEHDATNYVEFDLRKRGLPAYSVCVRRYHRPTPHELRKEADARAEAAEAKLGKVEALAKEWAAQPTDYDEDTEQQIDDGRAILAIIEGGE